MNQRPSAEEEVGQAISNIMRGNPVAAWGRGLLGAAIGAVAGWFVYFWLLDQGYDGLMIPGALVGFGFSTLAGRSGWYYGLVCGVIGLLLMLVCEWQSLLKFQNGPFVDFLMNIHQLNAPNKLMLAGGTLLAFWTGKGR